MFSCYRHRGMKALVQWLLRLFFVTLACVFVVLYVTLGNTVHVQPAVVPPTPQAHSGADTRYVPPLVVQEKTNHTASGVSTGGLWEMLPQNTSQCVPSVQTANTTNYLSMTPHCYNYIINNPNICADAPNLLVLIYVYSAPSSFKSRSAIRQTWGNKDLFDGRTLRIIFPVGATNDSKTQQQLQEENQVTGDIIQENYIDSYKNLSYKGIQSLKWIHKYCSHAKYILKVDTDVIVNVYLLRRLFATVYNSSPMPYIACKVYLSPVLRPGSWCWKWCVRSQEYKDAFYPRYCWGPAFFTSGKTFKAFYTASLTTPIWWIDDVYVTGLIPRNVGDVSHRSINDYWVEDPKHVSSVATVSPHRLLFGIIKNTENMVGVWKILQKYYISKNSKNKS